MQIRNLLEDDGAVSPVIGVILMVAITVILAAVIASFVLGLGDTAKQTTPQASFSFDYEKGGGTGNNLAASEASAGDPHGALTITHDGGDTIDHNRVTIVDDDSSDSSPTGFTSEISAGSTVTEDVGHDDTVRVIYEGESGDTSSTLATWEAPDA